MALLVRIYFNAVFGALGGLLGWMLFGIFGARTADSPQATALLGGALIGGVIGYFVVGVEALRDRNPVRFARLASYGVALGAVGGALGLLLGDWVNFELVGALGASRQGSGALHTLGTMLARGLGWMFLGVAIGVSEGIAARSLGKLWYGTVGGALGGFVGGALFGLLYLKTRDESGSASLWGALGLIILGACIGWLSALVQAVMQPASLRVLRGWQEGREYALDRASSLLGRDEHADVALFRDMKVEKTHAVIRRERGRYVLVNSGAPPEQTQVNGQAVRDRHELDDGDRIQLGNVVLRFHLRAVRAQAGKRPARSPAAAARPSPLGKT